MKPGPMRKRLSARPIPTLTQQNQHWTSLWASTQTLWRQQWKRSTAASLQLHCSFTVPGLCLYFNIWLLWTHNHQEVTNSTNNNTSKDRIINNRMVIMIQYHDITNNNNSHCFSYDLFWKVISNEVLEIKSKVQTCLQLVLYTCTTTVGLFPCRSWES